jgi:hypothetical protein
MLCVECGQVVPATLLELLLAASSTCPQVAIRAPETVIDTRRADTARDNHRGYTTSPRTSYSNRALRRSVASARVCSRRTSCGGKPIAPIAVAVQTPPSIGRTPSLTGSRSSLSLLTCCTGAQLNKELRLARKVGR